MGSEKGSYVLVTFEGGGSVAPFIMLARKLLANGHQVRIVSDECNRGEAVAAGADFSPWRRAPSRATRNREEDPIRDWEAPDGFTGFGLALDRLLVGRAEDYARDMIEILRDHPATLAVVSDLVLGAMAGCEALGQPFVALACNPLLFPMVDGIPPLGPGLPPAVMDEDKALEAEIKGAVMAMLDARLPLYNAQRANLGLQPLAHLVDQFYAAQRFLIATSPAFDFAPEHMPDFFAYVGPQLGDNLWSQPWTSPFAEDDARPLVLVAFSTTFQNQVGQLQSVIDALRRLDVRAVVTLGGALRREEFKGGANIHIVDSAPHSELLFEAALVITHGGHGTVIKTAVAGVPQLIIPHGRDQADNGVRIAYRSAGLMLPLGSDSAAIRCAAEKLLREPGYRQSAQALSQRIREGLDPDAITREVERIAVATFRSKQARVA